MAKNALVIEDEMDIAALIKLHLQDVCEEVTVAHNGRHGLDLALSQDWDIVLLDLQLPGKDGLHICKALRESGSTVPIIMITAKTSEIDRVLGLELGADDYLTKPFSVRELVARAKAIFRRSEMLEQHGSARQAQQICSGDLVIDLSSRDVVIGGGSVTLTAKEFDLLAHFASNPGVVFTRSQLLDQVWGYGHDGYEHTVNTHINRLRGKIEPDPSSPAMLTTVWGVGYRFGQQVTA
ncbi:MAG: response regulator transcription factor [Gammaproteobacteria bacterium]